MIIYSERHNYTFVRIEQSTRNDIYIVINAIEFNGKDEMITQQEKRLANVLERSFLTVTGKSLNHSLVSTCFNNVSRDLMCCHVIFIYGQDGTLLEQ